MRSFPVLMLAVLIGCSATHQPLGAVLPATIHYLTQPDGGLATNTNIAFTDDARNDCAAFQTRMEYGQMALLSGLGLPLTSLTDGRVVPWVTDAMARMGTGPRPAVSMLRETLSGLNLHEQSGSFIVEQAPRTGSPTLVFSLRSVDGRFSGTWRATPVCP